MLGVCPPLLSVDTGSLYTIVEPAFIAALGIAPVESVDMVEVAGIGRRLHLPCFALERLHCFGTLLSGVRVLALDFSRILPSIHGVLGLRELHASRATVDLGRNVVTTQ
jgi:hypothetical protein